MTSPTLMTTYLTHPVTTVWVTCRRDDVPRWVQGVDRLGPHDKDVRVNELLAEGGLVLAGALSAKEVAKLTGDLLSALVLPTAQRLGLVGPKLIDFAGENLLRFAKRTQERLGSRLGSEYVHPTVATTALLKASLEDDEGLQDMWAGLLASAADSTGKDRSVLPLMNVLAELSPGQAALLADVVRSAELRCENGRVRLALDEGAAEARTEHSTHYTFDRLSKLFSYTDTHQLTFELQALLMRSLLVEGHMITGGVFFDDPGNQMIDLDISRGVALRPSSSGLLLYARCMGHRDVLGYYDAPLRAKSE